MSQGGALVQLVAKGPQDTYLDSDNISYTFWKQGYNRCTNFAIESVELPFSGVADFGKTVKCSVKHNGDLLGKSFLQLELPALDISCVTSSHPDYDSSDYVLAYTENIGHAVINSVSLEIDGKIIDTQYGMWMEIWKELTMDPGKETGYSEMSGNFNKDSQALNSSKKRTYFIPLTFWFCQSPALALPLISIYSGSINLVFSFRSLEECLIILERNTNKRISQEIAQTVKFTVQGRETLKFGKCTVLADYIFLDKSERSALACVERTEILMEQLQVKGPSMIKLRSGKEETFDAGFKHPVKELVWVAQRTDTCESGFHANDHFNFSTCDAGQTVYAPHTGDIFDTDSPSAWLNLDGNNRFSPRPANYYRLVHPYKHHSKIPEKHVYCYSFSLFPEKVLPSGSMNFSRIQESKLRLKFSSNDNVEYGAVDSPNAEELFDNDKYAYVWIFAKNFNVLKIIKGECGVAYKS